MDEVDNQHANNGKMLGGCTGKGFMPGQSGNPKGRPVGSGLTDRLRRILDKDEGIAAEAIMQVAVDAAKAGDWRFWNSIMERVEGKVPDKIESDGNVSVIVEYKDQDARTEDTTPPPA